MVLCTLVQCTLVQWTKVQLRKFVLAVQTRRMKLSLQSARKRKPLRGFNCMSARSFTDQLTDKERQKIRLAQIRAD